MACESFAKPTAKSRKSKTGNAKFEIKRICLVYLKLKPVEQVQMAKGKGMSPLPGATSRYERIFACDMVTNRLLWHHKQERQRDAYQVAATSNDLQLFPLS